MSASHGLAVPDWGRLRQIRAITTDVYARERSAAGRWGEDPRGARMGDVWRDESPNLNLNQPSRLHPNEKPVPFMRRLLTAIDGVVVDPFMGSGSTLRAAKDMGRRAIGVEIEERYCEIAARRMGQEVLDVARLTADSLLTRTTVANRRTSTERVRRYRSDPEETRTRSGPVTALEGTEPRGQPCPRPCLLAPEARGGPMKTPWRCRLCDRDINPSHMKHHLAAHDRHGKSREQTDAEWLAFLYDRPHGVSWRVQSKVGDSGR